MRALLGCLVAIAGTTLGCDAVLGIEPLPRAVSDAGDASVGPAPIVYAEAACGTCVDKSCAASRDACLADPACAALYGDIAACKTDDPACRAMRERDDPIAAASAAYLALDACRRTSCIPACLRGAGLGAFLDEDCGCLDATCAAEELACVRSRACEQRLACISMRPDPDSYVECVNTHGGAVEATAVLDCFRRTSCGSCPIPTGKTSCVKNFQYARARTPTVDFTLGITPLEGEPRVDGAKVAACAPGRCSPCASVAGPVETAVGKATLTVPITEGAFDGCFAVTPPDASGGKLPTLVFPGRRIRQTEGILETISLPVDIFAFLAASFGKSPDPARGHVVVSLHDCIWGRVAGATLEVDAGGTDDETVLAYLRGQDVEIGATATTASGTAGIMNVKPGKRVLVARRGGDEIARIQIEVAANTVTDANMYPLSQ